MNEDKCSGSIGNMMRFKFINKYYIIVVIILLAFAILIFLLNSWLFNLNRRTFYIILFCVIVLKLMLYFKLYFARKIDLKRIKQKNIYHLLDKKKLKKILVSENNICLKQTKGLLKNYSRYGKKFVYFHSNFKGYSYFFNHFLKRKLPEYMLIVPVKNLKDKAIYTRLIDKAILYESEYLGKAKIVKVERFLFMKKLDKQIFLIFIFDLFYVMIDLDILIKIIISLLNVLLI